MASIDIEVVGAVAHITVNNPARRNAMSFGMWTTLGEAIPRLDADPAVRVLLLKGAGDKAFISGADISEFATLRSTPEGVAAYDHAVETAEQALGACSKPVVACIQGVCFGGGMGIAMACDLRYASDDAKFRMPAGRLGLGYALSGMAQIVNGIGAARTAELFYTARAFDGVEAERIGMVHKCHPAQQLDAEVAAIVAAIAANAPLTLRAAKLGIRASLPGAQESVVARAGQAIQACFTSADYLEGRQAFVEKRPARFTGT
jgi:enoyl-CoA hydratase/carnithine racemase